MPNNKKRNKLKNGGAARNTAAATSQTTMPASNSHNNSNGNNHNNNNNNAAAAQESREYTFNQVPFNFVPVNHEVFIPEWGDNISQDIPFEDGEDGIIRFKLTNTTPLFIKNDIDKQHADSAFVTDAAGVVRHYFIPATSLKGMVRSVMEILSFGWMKAYNKDSFGFRTFGGTQDSDADPYKTKMDTVQCGWLYMLPDGSYWIANCGQPQKVAMNKLPQEYQNVKQKNAVDKYKAFNRDKLGNYPLLRKDEKGKYVFGKAPQQPGDIHLVCSSHFYNSRVQERSKKHEHLFPPFFNSLPKLTVKEAVIDTFKSVYKPSPYYDFIVDTLRKGENLAVFFTQDESGNVDSIGITRMYRYPYKNGVENGIEQTGYDKEGNKATGRDLVECLFGYAEDKGSLKGRVQFGNAFMKSENGVTLGPQKNGVLGQPKASFYPYYLKQTNGPYDTYGSGEIEIAGRKRYRVQNKTADLPQRNGNQGVMAHFKPLPAWCAFTCEIRLHNVRPVEIGALLSALTFHNTPACHHNLGLAKAFGYGRMEVSAIELSEDLRHDFNFYLKEFEECMTQFLKGWRESPCLKQLLAIASDHSGDFGFMSLKGYKNGKRNDKFKKLQEEGVSPNSAIDIFNTINNP